MARPSVSEHLRVLREAGLVEERRAGRQRIYRLEASRCARSPTGSRRTSGSGARRLAGLRDLLDSGAADLPPGAGS
jgi:DNA-binding transcriptional ArsR family regulator